MHNRRYRFASILILITICASIGNWLFLWSTDLFLYWGANASVSRWLAVFFACVALSTIFIHPIPVKVSTIATITLVTFSLLFTGLHLLLKDVWSYAAATGWLWQGGIASIASTIAMLMHGYFHGKRMRLTRYTIHTPLPVPGGEFRIGLISDVHMGLTIDEAQLLRELDRLSDERPDLLIIAGDLVDDRTTPAQMRAACAGVGAFPSKYGSYFVYGNHDLANHGPKPPYSKQELDQALLEHGVTILDDQSISIAGITLVGRHDITFSRDVKRKSVEELLSSADRSKPIVMVDHQPREHQECAKAGVTLQLSGHTHAGQVWPMSWLIQLFSFAYGHKRFGEMFAIISAGMGNRGSVLRSGCTAEMVLIRLQNSTN